jgi:hypothetical protein
MEIIFKKSLASPAQWLKLALPNENWAPWRMWRFKIVCDRCLRHIFCPRAGGDFNARRWSWQKTPRPAGRGVGPENKLFNR